MSISEWSFVGLGLISVAVALLFWPRLGAVPRLIRLWRAIRRVEIEDALKYLYNCEYSGTNATLEGLSGALRISDRRVVQLATKLEALGLLTTVAEGLRLTESGRNNALHVIRIHRLWEAYLAEQTGVPPSAWHREADRREHHTTPEAAEALAARTGDPRFDPHGDAIPTVDGQIAPRRGLPLSQLGAGILAEVVHVEDEPQVLYDQLLARGVRPGTRVRLLDVEPEQLRVDLDGRASDLTTLAAANVLVKPLPRTAELEAPTARLSELELGESARVVRISPICRGLQRRRLFDLGLIPGTTVTAELRSPSGDPTAYRIRGTLIALRKEQADLIHVTDQERGRERS
jgi:DtxR family Mn-dependent transcriptional regulator